MRWREIQETISQEPALRYIAAAEKLIRDTFGGQIDLTLLDGSHDDGNYVTIVDIRAREMQRGLGTRAMQLLCDLADKMHIVLELGVANDEDNMGPPGEAKLIEWYERFGFEAERPGFAQERVEMRRDPEGYVRKDPFDAWRNQLEEEVGHGNFPQHLEGPALSDYIIRTDDIQYDFDDPDEGDIEFFDSVHAKFDHASADLKLIPLKGLEKNGGYTNQEALDYYRDLSTPYPPIIVVGNHIYEGNHRATLAMERGETNIWAYVVHGITKQELYREDSFFQKDGAVFEDGRIVKGVNTTCDVGEDEITIQAAKFGNKVSRVGVPANKLFETMLEPDQLLFHGTPIEHLIGIFIEGRIVHRPGIDKGHHGVSFTTDIDTAKGFAHEDCHESNILYREVQQPDHNPCTTGSIIYCRARDLGRIEAYDDTGGGELESEWRTFGDVPISAISGIALVRAEVEAYRADYLRARENIDIDHGHGTAHMPDEWKNDIKAWLHNPKWLAAIDAILASPLLRKWPI